MIARNKQEFCIEIRSIRGSVSQNRRDLVRVHVSYRALLRGWAFRPCLHPHPPRQAQHSPHTCRRCPLQRHPHRFQHPPRRLSVPSRKGVSRRSRPPARIAVAKRGPISSLEKPVRGAAGPHHWCNGVYTLFGLFRRRSPVARPSLSCRSPVAPAWTGLRQKKLWSGDFSWKRSQAS